MHVGANNEAIAALPYYHVEDPSENREVKSNELKVHGNTRTYNLNSLLAQNIMNSEYFKELQEIESFLDTVDEIYNRCSHVAPWAVGTSRIPSSAFCLLMKLFVLRVTKKQMYTLLNHPDSPYIRALGFLYLRYTCPPKELWGWFEQYLDDQEEIKPCPDASLMTMGQFVVKLIKEMQFYGTMLPRIPVKIERKMKVQLLLHQEKKKRAIENESIKDRLKAGVEVRAIYSDEDNDPAWYEAVIDSVQQDPRDSSNTGYWVTFPEYGNTSLVGLGEIQLLETKDESRSRSRDPHRERNRAERKNRDKEKLRKDDSKERSNKNRGRRQSSRERHGLRRSRSDSRGRARKERKGKRFQSLSRSGSRSRKKPADSLLSGSILDNPDALYQQVVENDRKASLAVGRDYSSRPTSYKGSLSLKPDRYTARKKSSSRSPERGRHPVSSGASKRRSRSPPKVAAKVEAKITVESLRKSEALKRKYGDASAKM